MEYATCNIVLVDRTAREDKLVNREDATLTSSLIDTPKSVEENELGTPISNTLGSNLQTLLETFSEG